MEKEIKVHWEDKEVEIVIKEITWKEKTDCIRKAMKTNNAGRGQQRSVDPILQKELMMVASIKQAPFEATLDNLAKLSSRDGEKIFKVYSDLNDYDDEEGESSSEI